MKKIFILLFIISISPVMKSQWLWDYGLNLGASNYLGDIGGEEQTRRNFFSDIKLAKTRWDVGLFARFRWQPKVSLKFAFDYIRIEGDDALTTNAARRYRNFNFKNDILEWSATGEYFFFEDPDLGNTYRYVNSFRAYVFGGVGIFKSNPQSIYRGKYVSLREYQTEDVSYKAIGVSIPMGVGFYFTFNKKNRIGFEINYRKTFTDYLDDISGNYPTKAPSDPYEQGLVLRTTELPPNFKADNAAVYLSHNWGQKRGDKLHKDTYMTMSLSYSYVVRGKSSFYKARRTGIFGGKKRKMRKIRAKF